MRDFRELKVWCQAHELGLEVYRETARLPQSELYGLTSQLRRAAVSITANIVEGSARGTDPAMCQFLMIAQGSAAELEYLLVLSRDLGYLPQETEARLHKAVKEVRRLLGGFVRSLRKSKNLPDG